MAIPTSHPPPVKEQMPSEHGASIQLTVLNADAGTPGVSEQTAQEPTPRMKRRMQTLENVQFAMLFLSLFTAGFFDGSTGPLLPRIQKVYNVNFTVVSMLFVSNCVGFVGGAIANVWLNQWLGFGKTILLGAVIQTLGHTLLVPAPPFAVFAIGYAISGFGISMKDAQASGYVASIKTHSSTKMGALHCAYGLGLFASPLVATQFARLPEWWAMHFLVALGGAFINAIALRVVFKGKSQADCLNSIGQAPEEAQPGSVDAPRQGHFRQIIGVPAVHTIALFLLVHVGVTATVGGWIVTFIIEKRGGDANAGYISAAYSGGLAVGRLALLPVNHKLGEWRAIWVYSSICIGLQLVVWRVPSLIGNAVAVSFMGLLMGPMFPIALNQGRRIIPRWVLTPSIGWIAGSATTGGAVLPFITGAVAQKVGIGALQPLVLGMLVVMVAAWGLVPRRRPVME